MKLYKPILKYMCILFCFLWLVATLQIGTAVYFKKSDPQLAPADLVVVFPGEKQRIESGLAIVKNNSHKSFMVTGLTQEGLKQLFKKNKVPETVTALPGGKSRSTFEDVYQTVKTIKENKIISITLVSSSYHLPRALFLLKLYLTISGEAVHIQYSFVNVPSQYINEVIKLWGSLVEMAGYYLTGELILNRPPVRKFQLYFKKIFLRQQDLGLLVSK